MYLAKEDISLKERAETARHYPEIIGESTELKNMLALITKVAPTESTVLILGETGTGKELVARAIHSNSLRRANTMIKINCAALPVSLIESELFGHERGSFTGATKRRIGKFELAHNSTIFLDEIGELPLELQVKLLRALQEREIERIGYRGTINVNVRVIAATNRDLEKEVEEGRFRADLYYRLNIFPINMPPLRDRREDIPLLMTHFIEHLTKKMRVKITKVSERAVQEIMDYNWPGNIRQLEHVIERSILLSNDESIRHFYLPPQKKNSINPFENIFILKTLEEMEREHILTMLKHCKGKIGGYKGAAEYLGVPTSTLRSKIERLGISKRDYKI